MRKNIFRELTEEKWQQIITHPFYQPIIEEIKAKSEEFLNSEPPRIKFSDMHVYYTVGSRQPHERNREEYIQRLVNHKFMYLYTKDEKYLPFIEDIIWDMCGFETWSRPYSFNEGGELERRAINLDLGSTDMGYHIAEALYLIGDKLHPLVYRRARAEVQRRIIDAYANNDDFWWMNTTLNWAAVCTGNIMSTYILLATDEEIEAQLPRMLRTFELYMSGFDEDGCCPEGLGYRAYGFTHYCKGASMLRDYTDGRIDLFRDEKVHKVARFQQNAIINETEVIAFSDSGMVFAPSRSFTHFLKTQYDDIIVPPMKEPHTLGDLRTLCWMNPDYESEALRPESVIFRGAQWFVHRTPVYSLACKGGSNGEPHNHNDVGSFVISKGGAGCSTFLDPGIGEYTRQYFDPELRYTHVLTSSRGHSVPIIDGNYQVIGKEKCTVTAASENEYAFDMQQAYQLDNLKRLNRSFVCKEASFTLTDTYSFESAPQCVTERFISLEEPKLVGGKVKVGESYLVFDPEVFELSFSSENGRRGGKDIPVYFTDLKIKNPAKEMQVSVRFE